MASMMADVPRSQAPDQPPSQYPGGLSRNRNVPSAQVSHGMTTIAACSSPPRSSSRPRSRTCSMCSRPSRSTRCGIRPPVSETATSTGTCPSRSARGRSLPAVLRGNGASAVIRLGCNGALTVEHRVAMEGTGALSTRLLMSTRTSGILAPFVDRAALRTAVHSLGIELSTRARWLDQSPNTRFPGRSPRSGAGCESGSAPLEQLQGVSRELEGGIFSVDCGAMRCLIDAASQRFVRVEPDADLARYDLVRAVGALHERVHRRRRPRRRPGRHGPTEDAPGDVPGVVGPCPSVKYANASR